MRHLILLLLAAEVSVCALHLRETGDIQEASESETEETEYMNDAAESEAEEFSARFRAAAKPSSSKGYLFIAVYLSPESLWKADFIRNTSMKDLEHRFDGSVDMKFVIGTREIPAGARKNLMAQQGRHGDYLLLDIPDTYDKLTGKTAALIRWVATNSASTAKYILKADDDSYIRVGKLLRWLRQEEQSELTQNTVYGLLQEHRQVLRPGAKFSKWWEEKYPETTYPMYADGGAYIFTKSLAQTLHEHWKVVQENMFHNEDASLGIWNRLINASFQKEEQGSTRFIYYRGLPVWKEACRQQDIINGDVDIRQFSCFWQKESGHWQNSCCQRFPDSQDKDQLDRFSYWSSIT